LFLSLSTIKVKNAIIDNPITIKTVGVEGTPHNIAINENNDNPI